MIKSLEEYMILPSANIHLNAPIILDTFLLTTPFRPGPGNILDYTSNRKNYTTKRTMINEFLRALSHAEVYEATLKFYPDKHKCLAYVGTEEVELL